MKKHLPMLRVGVPLSLLLAVVLSGVVTLLALWLQPNSLRTVLTGFLASPWLIVLNALPVGLLILTLACLLRNVFWSAALVNLLVGALSIGNRIKLEVRDEPVFPRDLGLLKEVGSAVGSYDIQFPWGAIALLLGCSVLFLFLGIFIRCKAVSPDTRQSWLPPLLGAFGSFATLLALIFTVYASNDLYGSFPVSNAYYVPSVFNELGFPYCFTHHFTTYAVDKPSSFHRAEAEDWDTGGEALGASKAADVHVILVMDEAFSDLTDWEMFTYGAENDPLPNLHALRRDANCVSGHVVVPNFAGGTANTEFDVLTGMQTSALSATTTSAFRAFNRNLDSLLRVYGADGAHTSFFHPGDPWFYNRENVYSYLGADETLFAPDMPDLTYKGRWATDAYLAELILKKFEDAVADGNTLINYTTTIQNHMSYTLDKYGADYDYPPIQTSAEVSPEAESLLRVYVEGARDADAMLGRLVSYFREREEPVVLAFWGDHLPNLGNDQLAYRELGATLSPEENGVPDFLRAYETPYVIWANDAAASALDWQAAAENLDLPENGTISACFLGATVLELTGRAAESPWFQYLTEVRRALPVIQKETVMLPDGTVTTADTLDEQQSALVEKLRNWSYYKLKYKDVG